MNIKSDSLIADRIAYCTVCGGNLKDQKHEKYQIRWDNKNSGVCQSCVVALRKSFKTQRNKTPIKFRNKQFYELVEFDEQCVAMAESDHGIILGEVKDSESDITLGVLIEDNIDPDLFEDCVVDFEDEPSDDELRLIELSEEQD